MPQRRISVLIALVVCGSVLLVGRLVQLQVVEFDRHAQRAERIRLRKVLVPGRRATIVDRHGVVLAHDEPVWELQLNYWLYTEPANILHRIDYRGGVPGMTPAETNRLIEHLQRLADYRANRHIPRPKRFRDTWPGRQDVLVLAELNATTRQLAAVLGVPAEGLLRQLHRVAMEVDHVLVEAGGRYTEQYAEIVRLGGSPGYWDDLARDERASAKGSDVLRYQENPLVLASGVSRARVETVVELDRLFPGVTAEARAQRVYPEGCTACHLLGYLRPIDRVGFTPKDGESSDLTHSPFFRQRMELAARHVGPAFIESHFRDIETFRRVFRRQVLGSPVGVTGLERWYESRLSGRYGASVLEKDVHARTQRVIDEVDPAPARDMALTIDTRVQATAQAELARVFEQIGCAGAVVVMDVHTGQVLALASGPDFDLNRLMGTGPEDRDYMARLFANETADGHDAGKPMFNRAVHATVAPGSVFKILTGVAAASNSILHGPRYDGLVPCTGHWAGRESLGIGRGFTCHGGHACGQLDLAAALERSCNVYFHDIGHQLGYDRLRAMAGAFGFGERTGIDFAEYSGWRRGRDGTRINRFLPAIAPSAASAALMSIGQGRLLASPLQVCRFMCGVATEGRLPRPYLDASADPFITSIEGIDPGVWPSVREGLRRVVSGAHGTARRIRGLKSLDVAGKTGTAQTGRKRDGKELNFAWFAGYAPAANPQVAFAVYIEDTFLSGGQAAAPVAAAVLDTLAASPDYAAAFGRDPVEE